MKTVLIVIGILVIFGLLVSGWLFSSSQFLPSQNTPSPSVTSSVSVQPTNAVSTTQLPTKYISSVDWPPVERIENQPFSCTQAGSETQRAGETQKVTIDGHIYCVTKETEGAAGSIYTSYAYARANNNQTEIFTFSLRFVQCGNYPEPEKSACEKEQQTFNVDTFMDQYIQSK